MEAFLSLNDRKLQLLLVFIAGCLFIPFLGEAHLFDWDEINFAEAAREMVVTGNYSTVQIDYQPFWEKPPLFFWMQALSMKLFGINEFASRFPNALCGILTILLLFRYGRLFKGRRTGLLWAMLYMASLLPHFYFKSGIIDPWFNLFIFIGMAELVKGIQAIEHKTPWMRSIIFSAVATGLAVMTKGPVGLLIVLMVFGAWWAFSRFKLFFNWKHITLYALVFLFTGSIWFLIEILNGRMYIVQDFIDYQVRLFNTQDAGHGGPFFYHWIVLLVGCFPASIFFINGLIPQFKRYASKPIFVKWMILCFWLVLLLFSIVKTKIVHYSSMCYFPITYLAAVELDAILKGERRFALTPRIFYWTIGAALGLLLLFFSQVENLKDNFTEWGLVKDEFGKASLQASANWHGFEFMAGLLFILGFVFLYLFVRKQRFLLPAIGSAAIAIVLSAWWLAPNVEAYSQRAAIEFYEDHAQEECLIYPIGFKSYAHLFYSEKQPGLGKYGHSSEEVLQYPGEFDIPVYFVGKIQQKKEHLNTGRLEVLYEKNGFVFYEVASSF